MTPASPREILLLCILIPCYWRTGCCVDLNACCSSLPLCLVVMWIQQCEVCSLIMAPFGLMENTNCSVTIKMLSKDLHICIEFKNVCSFIVSRAHACIIDGCGTALCCNCMERLIKVRREECVQPDCILLLFTAQRVAPRGNLTLPALCGAA